MIFNPSLVRGKSIEHLRSSFRVTHVGNFSAGWLSDIDSFFDLSREIELSILYKTVIMESFIIFFWVKV